MDEYISREATVKAFCEKCKGYYDGHCVHRGECDIDVIQTAPAADVQPVIHSRWIPTGDGTYNAYCENCGQERGSKSWNKNDFKYCFGCGARMDGDESGDAD